MYLYMNYVYYLFILCGGSIDNFFHRFWFPVYGNHWWNKCYWIRNWSSKDLHNLQWFSFPASCLNLSSRSFASVLPSWILVTLELQTLISPFLLSCFDHGILSKGGRVKDTYPRCCLSVLPSSPHFFFYPFSLPTKLPIFSYYFCSTWIILSPYIP